MIWERFASVAGQFPDQTAVHWEDTQLSYRALLREAELLSQSLAAAGAGPGCAIAAVLGNHASFLVALLAVARLKAVFVPIDPSLKEAEIERIRDELEFHLAIGSPTTAERLPKISPRSMIVRNNGEVASVQAGSPPPPALDPKIGLIQFTSGSTGRPKGILLGHEAILHRALDLARSLGLQPHDRTLCSIPLSHSHGIECLALTTILTGGTLFLKPPEISFPLNVLKAIELHRITFFSTIPSFYDLALELVPETGCDLSSLRLPFCGSAALGKETAERFFDRFGVHIKQGYGLVEIGVICLNLHEEKPIVYNSVGKPIFGMEWRIEGSAPDQGELVVRSKGLFEGYFNADEETRSRLKGGELYTNDLVSIDSRGLIYIVGRKNEFINVAGKKVFPQEIEAKLMQYEFIRECAVIGERDSLTGEAPVAYLVPRAGLTEAEQQLQEERIVQGLQSILSSYKVPRNFIWKSDLPKSPLGKILRAKLRSG